MRRSYRCRLFSGLEPDAIFFLGRDRDGGVKGMQASHTKLGSTGSEVGLHPDAWPGVASGTFLKIPTFGDQQNRWTDANDRPIWSPHAIPGAGPPIREM
jgi:hypothetical protein